MPAGGDFSAPYPASPAHNPANLAAPPGHAQIDDAGAIDAARQKRKEEIRLRLAAGAGASSAGAVAEDASVPVQQVAADYYTTDEMAKFQKPKKKKERKLKKKALTEEEMAALETEAVARGGSDLGSRASRHQRVAEKAAAASAADAERRSRFDHALSKANYASLALRPETRQEDEDPGLGEDEDLYASLNKARQLAQKKEAEEGGDKPESMAEQLIKRREEQQKAATAAALAGAADGAGDGSLVFTDMAEIARTITVKQEAAPAAQQQQQQQQDGPGGAAAGLKKEEAEEEDNYGLGGDAMETEAAAGPAHTGAAGDTVWAGWVPASAGAEGETTAAEMRQKLRAKQQQESQGAAGGEQQAEVKEEESGLREKVIGSGLAGALAFLKDRGELEAPVEWSGRTNEKKRVNTQGLDEVYTGGRQEDRIALDVEVALTRKDEYGRILTPKEAFRQLCYRFHGIQPSKNSREKRQKKAAEEVAKKKTTSGAGMAGASGSLTQMQQVRCGGRLAVC